MRREMLCWSTGPRISGEGVPYCLKLAGHDGDHEAHPDSGFDVSWGDPLCKANPDTIRTAWLPDELKSVYGGDGPFTTGIMKPLVLEDLRRLVAATEGWSPQTIVQVQHPDDLSMSPKRCRTALTVIRGSISAPRKTGTGNEGCGDVV